MVVTPPPVPERAQTETQSRTLAYQEKIARAAEKAKEEETTAPQTAVPAETPPAAKDEQKAATPEAGPHPSATGQGSTEMAGLPPDEEGPGDPNALPWQQPGRSDPQVGGPGMDDGMADPMAPQREAYGDPNDPMAPRREAYGDPDGPMAPQQYGDPYDPRAPRQYGDPYDPRAPQPGEYGDRYDPRAPRPGPYGDPSDSMAGLPHDEADPNAWPGEAQERPQQWVQVLVSGVEMHGTASEDAPMLFAFPYGRVLRVVSRYGDWIEVTDPKSAATGWIQARYLAPVAAPGPRQAAGPIYEGEPRQGRRWWRRLWRSF